MMRNPEEQTEEQSPAADVAYDLRTHLTDATLAADFLRRADADCDDETRQRVHEHLKEAHEALYKDVCRLDKPPDE